MPPAETLRAARPAIALDGQNNPSLAEGLLNLEIIETTAGLYRCEAHFGNWGNRDNEIDFLYFDRRILDFGKGFRVKVGADTLFDGRVLGLEARFPSDGPPTIVVLAEDRFQDLRMTRRTRTFSDASDAEVCRQIASEHGLTAEVNLSGPTYRVLAQINQSDLAFLRERARANDAEVWMNGRTLNVKPHSERDGGTLALTYQQKLHEFTVLADLAGQRTSVTVSGWDVGGKAGLLHEATDAVIQGELNGDTSGASILRSALGARKESLVHTVPLTSQEAQAEAEAFFKLSARRFLTGQGVADGDSRLRVGSYVNLLGLGPLFNGKYYLAEVRHLFDGMGGLRTEFKAERPGLGRAN